MAGRLVGWLWLSLLALVLLASARSASRLALSAPEVAYGCDSFGYLRMAREIRHAASTGALPDFGLESAQTRLLIDHLRSQEVRPGNWHELVAPHAHHYFRRADHVAVQYPPGTGLALAIFPEGEAVHRLSRLVIWTLLATGWLALLLAGIRQAWAAAGLVVLSLHLGLEILVRLAAASFSIPSVLLPILFACLLALAASILGRTSGRLSWIAALGAGSFLGAAVLVRIPSFLLLPGLLLLLWPRSWRDAARGPAGAMILGFIVLGVAPLLFHQWRVAGAWYLPTYSRSDAAPPAMTAVGRNLRYFLGDGPGGAENWALLAAIAGVLGWVLLARARRRDGQPSPVLSWQRVVVAALAIWTASTAFFVTHQVTTPYYTAPGTFGAVALLGFGALAIETMARRGDAMPQRGARAPAVVAALGLLLLPGVVTAARARRLPSLSPPEDIAPTPPIALPAELAADRAWVYADQLTGSLWYYGNKPAFKIPFSDLATRARVYRFVFERGEPQYLIRDSDAFEEYLDEVARLGGTLEERGRVAGSPYFRIRWPESGPASQQTLAAAATARR